MAKSPTNATKTTPPKMGAAAPKAAETSTAKTDDANAGAADAAAAAKLYEQTQTGNVIQPVDVDVIKAEAYKEGYSNGFSAALDEVADQPTGQSLNAESAADGPGYDRAHLISLAIYTPENQRKGGMFVVVDRLETYLDSLPEEDRYPAIGFMMAIAQTSPTDLVTGRFKLTVNECLASLNGDGPKRLTVQEEGEASAAALERLHAAAPDLDVRPGSLADEPNGELGANFDPDDPDSPQAAASRLARA